MAPPVHNPRRAAHSHPATFILGLLLPIVGFIMGIIRAFDPDPERKKQAGYYFSGAVVGMVLGYLLVTYAYPTMVAGPAAVAYNQGVKAYSAEKWVEAEQEFRKAIEADSNYAAAWVNLAVCQVKQQNGIGAEESARKAISLLDSGSPGALPDGETVSTMQAMAHGNLAAALALQVRVPEAAAEAQKALDYNPSHPAAANLRALIQAAQQMQSQ